MLCAAEVLGMLGNATFPALIPEFRALWSLSNTEAGWISGVYYAGYVAAVPLLVSLVGDDDPNLRVAAAEALRHIGGGDAV
ncbi:MAG: HEAT repeat domain-containing protein, partial [Pseudomonadota bacterium]